MSVTVHLEAALLTLLLAGCTPSVETTVPPDVVPASCAAAPQCGSPTQSCCASPTVEGGTYNRLNDPKWPATVSSFQLDTFEVTVGRLRTFVEAYPGSKPKAGAGEHPRIPGSGWRAEWDENLPATQADLRNVLATLAESIPPQPERAAYIAWTAEPAGHEQAAADMMSWYLAFGFCAWDGGRLPTGAEWNYAAVGGAEQRPYPWGAAAPDPSFAVLRVSEDGALEPFSPVGSKPAGVGRFGQLDLDGNRFEWMLDAEGTMDPGSKVDLPLPCHDCAKAESSVAIWRSLRNESFFQLLSNAGKYMISEPAATHDVGLGLRCARDLP